jgi:hypothetical protein
MFRNQAVPPNNTHRYEIDLFDVLENNHYFRLTKKKIKPINPLRGMKCGITELKLGDAYSCFSNINNI